MMTSETLRSLANASHRSGTRHNKWDMSSIPSGLCYVDNLDMILIGSAYFMEICVLLFWM